MGYIGNEPTTGHFPVDNFTSSGGSTYTLAKAPASAGAIEVSVQGVLQPTTAYTVSGTTLTMAGVTTGVKIFVRHLGETLVLPTPADGSVTTTKLGTNSVDGTKIAMGSDARGDILYHGATDYARLAKGTSGQVLTMGANDPAWATAAAAGWIQGTEQATTSGSQITFGSIPSGTKAIAIMLDKVSTSGTGYSLRVRIGDAGGIENSGYSGGSGQMLAAASAAASETTYWNIVGDGSVAANNYSGRCELRLQQVSTYTWVQSGSLSANTGGHAAVSAGMKALSAELTQVQVYSHNTFDGGAVNIQYMS
jgi:hypothetical protein